MPAGSPAGRTFKANHAKTSEWYSSRRIGERCSGYKLLVEEDSDRILGAHPLAANSEDIINILAMCIRLKVSGGQLKEVIFT
jgi:glutathione reductase (NADPH)